VITALVLICSLAIAPDIHDCTEANATDVIRAPIDSALSCNMRPQAYLAGTEIGRALRPGERARVICPRV
jgi:hypothetical protein